jgi:hypothetical protein
MSRGGAMPMTSPTGWVYLSSGDGRIRWQCGDKVVYIFEGKHAGSPAFSSICVAWQHSGVDRAGRNPAQPMPTAGNTTGAGREGHRNYPRVPRSS